MSAYRNIILLLVFLFRLPSLLSQTDPVVYDTVVIIEEPVVIKKTVYVKKNSDSTDNASPIIEKEEIPSPTEPVKETEEIIPDEAESRESSVVRMKKHSLGLFYNPIHIINDNHLKTTDIAINSYFSAIHNSKELGLIYTYSLNSSWRLSTGISYLSFDKEYHANVHEYIETQQTTISYLDTTDSYFQIIGQDTVVFYIVKQKEYIVENDIYEDVSIYRNELLGFFTIPLSIHKRITAGNFSVLAGGGLSCIVPLVQSVKKEEHFTEVFEGYNPQSHVSFSFFASLHAQYFLSSSFFIFCNPSFSYLSNSLYTSSIETNGITYYWSFSAGGGIFF